MKIAVHAFDGITMFHLAAPLIVFETASTLGLAPEWRTTVWTSDGRSIRTSEGLVIDGLAGPGTTADADLLVFPSWPIELAPPDDEFMAIVQGAHRRGARIAGLCLGAFPVAASGVLDGRSAVTHWAAADALAAQNPTVNVQRSALYIDHEDVLTSAGTASAMEDGTGPCSSSTPLDVRWSAGRRLGTVEPASVAGPGPQQMAVADVDLGMWCAPWDSNPEPAD